MTYKGVVPGMRTKTKYIFLFYHISQSETKGRSGCVDKKQVGSHGGNLEWVVREVRGGCPSPGI